MVKCDNPNKLIKLIKEKFKRNFSEPTTGKIVFRLDNLICNIFLTTGTVNFQGKIDEKTEEYKNIILNFIEDINSEFDWITTKQFPRKTFILNRALVYFI